MKNSEEPTIEERMKHMEEIYERDHNIFCPYCGAKQDEETVAAHTTYHGEPNREEDELETCSECDKEFRVKESVNRTFETEKIHS